MAGDWIKMRPSLLTSPKVNGIARILEESPEVGRALSVGTVSAMRAVVTRNVMRNVTVAALLTVWGAANEHTTDGVFTNADISDIDDMVGIPGFGAAMMSVGWASVDKAASTVTLPNFNEYNTCGRDRAAEKNAERQRRFREKHRNRAAEGNENRNVTNNVTNNDREEKRREEKKKEEKHSSGRPDAVPPGFARFWSVWPKTERKVAKADCIKKWKASGLEAMADEIVASVQSLSKSKTWRDGFEPAPKKFLNERRWEDDDLLTSKSDWWVEQGYGSEDMARRDGRNPGEARAA